MPKVDGKSPAAKPTEACTDSAFKSTKVKNSTDPVQTRTKHEREVETTKHMVEREPFRRELKAKLNPKRPFVEGQDYSKALKKKKAVSTAVASVSSQPTVSSVILNQQFPNLPIDTQVRKAIASTTEIDEDKVPLAAIELVKDIASLEAQHPEAHFAYHALKSSTWFADRVMSHMRHALEGTDLQTDVLRNFQSVFEKTPTINDLRFFSPEGGVVDHSKDYHGLACNPSLFSNNESMKQFESTLYFFLSGSNAVENISIQDLCETLFNALDLPTEELIAVLEAIYKEELAEKETTGALLQIMFEGDDLFNQATYVSTAFGNSAVELQEGKYIKPADLSRRIKEGDKLTLVSERANVQSSNEQVSSNNAQLRLHGDLPTFAAQAKKGECITVRDFFNGDADLSKIDERIEAALKDYMPQILHALLRDKNVYASLSPDLQRAARAVLDVSESERAATHTDEKALPVVQAFSNNDFMAALALINADPNVVNTEFMTVDGLTRVSLADTWVKSLSDIADQDLRAKVAAFLEQTKAFDSIDIERTRERFLAKMGNPKGSMSKFTDKDSQYISDDTFEVISLKMIDAFAKLNSIAELDSLIQNVKDLTVGSTSFHDRRVTIDILLNFDNSQERDDFVKLIKGFVQDFDDVTYFLTLGNDSLKDDALQDSSYHQIQLIKRFAHIETEAERAALVRQVLTLVEKYETVVDVHWVVDQLLTIEPDLRDEMIDRLSRMPKKGWRNLEELGQIKSQYLPQLLKVDMPKQAEAAIIETIFELDTLMRDQIIAKAAQYITEGMSQEEVRAVLLACAAEINPKEDIGVLIEHVLKFVKADITDADIKMIIEKLEKTPSEIRSQNIDHAEKLIKAGVKFYQITDALHFLDKIAPQNKARAVEILCNLITEKGIKGELVGILIWRLNEIASEKDLVDILEQVALRINEDMYAGEISKLIDVISAESSS